MKVEYEYIISVLKDELPSQENLDYNYILGFLELNKISGYFYNQCKKLGIRLPHNVDRKLCQITAMQKQRNAVMQKYIRMVRDKLASIGLEYVFLKGSVLSNCNMRLSELAFKCMQLTIEQAENYSMQRNDTFYSSGERISNDIDILLQGKDLSVATRALKELGFQQGYYNFKKSEFIPLSRKEILSRRMNRGETAPFILILDNEVVPFVEVDINFSLGFLPTGDEDVIATMLDNKINYAGIVEGGIFGLQTMDFFMHLVTHQYKESILKFMVDRNKDLELYKLLDMYLFIKNGLVRLEDIVTYAKVNKLEKATYYVLSLLNDIFDDIEATSAINSLGTQEDKLLNEVQDPGSGKIYKWEIPFVGRIIRVDRKDCLVEVASDE